jgi:hypothetical protein
MVWDNQKKILFVHIPKSGGTTIEHHMGAINNPNKGYKRNTNNKAMQHLTIEEYNALFDDKRFDNYCKFTIVRNPYDKMLSEYYWTDLPIGYKDKHSFDYFLGAVSDIVINKNYNYTFLHDHFTPQKEFITDENNNIIVDKIFKFEEFNEVVEFVQMYYPNINTTVHNKIKTAKSKNSRLTLNDKQKNIIYNLYEDDFILLGYDK